MKRQLWIIALALLPLGLMAQDKEDADQARPAKEKSAKEHESRSASEIFTGFSGGMMLHGGYLFSDDPRKVFSNSGLGTEEYIKGLPKSGFTMGLGGALRVHLLHFIHVGAEGFVSTMPMMGTGSNIRTGWGGAFCDVFTKWGKVHPMIGLGLGGGAMRRLYVPDQIETVYFAASDSTHYNASFTKTPFFYLDPYVGLEIGLNNHMALLIRIDYLLPFGRTSSNLTKAAKDIKWSNFMSPSGPRLYLGIMFGRLKKE